MKASYISYFEGYNAIGAAVFNGNGSVTVEFNPDEGINPEELLNKHIECLLKVAQEKNSRVTRVVIKNISRL
ncbi:hypothetical protein [Enterobacter asburiae]|uniref:hypothetical protein n=1 Tax=Enterobacter asburiae TaxID=61645 RepID=UPI003F550197